MNSPLPALPLRLNDYQFVPSVYGRACAWYGRTRTRARSRARNDLYVYVTVTVHVSVVPVRVRALLHHYHACSSLTRPYFRLRARIHRPNSLHTNALDGQFRTWHMGHRACETAPRVNAGDSFSAEEIL